MDIMGAQVNPFTQVPPQVVHHWGLFLFCGLGLIGLAIIASIRSARATLDSVYVFGWLLVLASAIESLNAYLTGGWTGFYLNLVGAVLFGVTGYMLLAHATTKRRNG